MQIPDITLPHFMTRLGRLLPSMPPELVLVITLNQLLKRNVLPAQMDLLAGHSFEVDVLDAGLTLRFAADETGFRLEHSHGKADLRFAANTADFARMMLREEDPDTLFFNRKLAIEGDTELGLTVKNLLDSIDWSETPLAHFIPV